MARPQKKGLDYFPFDVDFFQGIKIRITMARYGASGVLLFIYLLSIIYSNGYYVEYNEDLIYIAAADLQMKPENIGQIINFFCKRSLFDNKLFTTDKVLTSVGIQKRYQEMVKSRAKKNTVTVNAKLWLLKKEETQSFIKVHPNSDNSEKNDSYSKKNSFNSKNNTIKESKVKKSKVNERRVVLQLPCTNGNYDVTSEQIDTLQQANKSIDVMQSFRKMLDYLKCHPNSKRPLDAMENRIIMWLTQDNAKALSEQKQEKPKTVKSSKSDNTSYDINVFNEYDIFE